MAISIKNHDQNGLKHEEKKAEKYFIMTLTTPQNPTVAKTNIERHYIVFVWLPDRSHTIQTCYRQFGLFHVTRFISRERKMLRGNKQSFHTQGVRGGITSHFQNRRKI